MIQLEKPVLTGTMPVVWPTILDLGRDECKRILRKLGTLLLSYIMLLYVNLVAAPGAARQRSMVASFLSELEAYAGVISALRAQGDLTKDKKDLLGELTKILG